MILSSFMRNDFKASDARRAQSVRLQAAFSQNEIGNLIAKLRCNQALFPGIVGYEDTVVPSLVNAVLARHNFILLGLQGRRRATFCASSWLLDPEIPVLSGTETNDNPFAPHLQAGRLLVEEEGMMRPSPGSRASRATWKTPLRSDVAVADLIGDMDPIRARGGHLLSDELTIHFGLLPRANRGSSPLTSCRTCRGKVQVGLFNVMQEGDVQIEVPGPPPAGRAAGIQRQP